MQTELAQFKNWLTCQYPHLRAKEAHHERSGLCFLWAVMDRIPMPMMPPIA